MPKTVPGVVRIFHRNNRSTPLAVACLLALAACAPEPSGELRFTAVPYDQLPGWTQGRHAEALGALSKSCAALVGKPRAAPVGMGPAARPAADWAAACVRLRAVPAGNHDAARAYFERWFVPHRVAEGDKTDGLFTGYFEPLLRGSYRRGGRYTVPLYTRPKDLVNVDLGKFRKEWQGESISGRVVRGALQPYRSRAEIEARGLRGLSRVLVWVDDPADAFFLHIQGSGRVVMPDGKVLRVGYAGKNGRKYRSIGRYLVKKGAFPLEKASMQSIKAWLEANPREARKVMNHNAAFVFFKRLKGDGPLGAQGVALTPERSLAVDRRYVPLGTPLWLDTTFPLSDRPLRRLFIAQDTGGAIKGPVRGDVFWGHGPKAAKNAGRMKQRGTYYLLLPRPAKPASG